MNLHLTTGLLGLALAALILLLLRRDHLYVMHALFWVLVAAAAAVLGLWPGLIDRGLPPLKLLPASLTASCPADRSVFVWHRA